MEYPANDLVMGKVASSVRAWLRWLWVHLNLIADDPGVEADWAPAREPKQPNDAPPAGR
jgi:hypothetical protein